MKTISIWLQSNQNIGSQLFKLGCNVLQNVHTYIYGQITTSNFVYPVPRLYLLKVFGPVSQVVYQIGSSGVQNV